MTMNGVYGYYVTDTFPWILACLTGMPDLSFGRADTMRARPPE